MHAFVALWHGYRNGMHGTFLITPHLQTMFLSAFIDGAKVPGMFSAIPADTSISS